jgi:hypothetical protein
VPESVPDFGDTQGKLQPVVVIEHVCAFFGLRLESATIMMKARMRGEAAV